MNILSFGCATGEECFTLLKYFPSSSIFGVDINKERIDICRNNNTNSSISFIQSNYENIKMKSPFNMIFCLSVLCNYGTGNDNYKFSEFDGTLVELDSFLSKNGLLVIYNSNFRFSDASIYHKYKVLPDNNISCGDVPKYDKNNIILNNYAYKDTIFIKIND